MARKKYLREEDPDIFGVVFGISLIPVLYFMIVYYTNKEQFWYEIHHYIIPAFILFFGVVCVVLYFVYRKNKIKKERELILETKIQENVYKSLFANFVNRFDKEGKKSGWSYRGHSFDYKRMEDFRDTLISNGLEISNDGLDELFPLVVSFIDNTEKEYIANTLGNRNTHNLDELSKKGDEFEHLVVRLYDSMGYTSKRIGGTGDQGADVIAIQNGESLVIQAKCYTNTVGNAAVQQASAAQQFYSGTRAIVITTNAFTREAIELAKATSVELIDGERLKRMLAEHLHENWQ